MGIPMSGARQDRADGSTFYDYGLTITFGELNSEGTVDHDKYATLLGKARELFALECVPGFAEQVMNQEYLLHTRESHFRFNGNFRFGDGMIVRIRIAKVERVRFEVKADFIHVAPDGITADAILAEGSQVIVFTDLKGKAIRIPEGFKRALTEALPKIPQEAIPL
jgi:acyl-CoA thioesterase FadM